MKVNLIQYVGQYSPDPSRTAAEFLIYIKSTRLQQGPDTREKIANMTTEEVNITLHEMAMTIRSSWEFLDYTFEISGVTRAFTHQFVRTRQGSYAQQTMRTVDMDGFDVTCPSTIENDRLRGPVWSHCIRHIRDAYKDLVSDGVPPEDARGLLPTNVQTNIIAKFNLRTLADMAGKRQNPRAQQEYQDVFKAMANSVLAVHPFTRVFLYPERTRTPAIDQLIRIAKAMWKAHPEAYVNGEIERAQKEIDQLKGVWG
jgi:flavin-dependent thymidylate synthase